VPICALVLELVQASVSWTPPASKLGYISQKMFKELMERVGVQVITKLKRNMKQRLVPFGDRLLLRKRAVVETVIDPLKNISQIEHSRHRSPVNCFVNILCGLGMRIK
jgi:Transposase DDE domain